MALVRSFRSQCNAKRGITASKRSVFMAFSSAARRLYGVRSSQTLPIRVSTAAASRSQIPLTPRAIARMEVGSTSARSTGILLLQAARDEVHVGLSLLDAHTWPQTRDRQIVMF